MRKTLFRCKLKDSGEWIYWDMLGRITTRFGKISKHTIKRKAGESHYFFAHQLWNIMDRATVGECVGLKDGFKNLIFEGDILVGPFFEDDDGYGVVSWINGGWEVKSEHVGCPLNERSGSMQYDILGNVHDNPELLGGADV